MKHSLQAPEFLIKLRTAVRSKPAMYFGCRGSTAIPAMLNDLAIAVLQDSQTSKATGLEVEIGETSEQVIALHFQGVVCRSFASFDPGLLGGGNRLGTQLAMTLAASERCTVRVLNGRQGWELSVGEKNALRCRRLAREKPAGVTVHARLHKPTFGELSPCEFHSLGSMLRDLSTLRPGLATSLRKAGTQLAWCYPEGLKSFVYEMDHSRWPLHPGCLHFGGSREGMAVEGCIRFVHAGVPEVRSWVNFHPSHGGAHFEGLGDALKKLFPDADAGCRRVRFVTNPDRNAHVLLPHPFVAALHFQSPDARFDGPTRDILLGKEVREFVNAIASAVLPGQWEELRRQRL